MLRIEDTDRARSTAASEAAIVASLRWAGIEWDEGPDVGGAHGPYRQSERVALYREHAERLLAQGDAFHCFCSPERLDALRRAQRERGENPGYDGHCLGLPEEERRRRLAAGEPSVIRLRVPREGACRVEDRLRGAIEIPWTQVDMQVLVKSDGFPTYHLAVVVDDHLMGITHVLRGEEWIGSLPKHALLYRRLGWDMPEHAHLPLLRNPDRSKLSKRRNPTSLGYFRDVGYLPEALLNYLGLMGWSMPDEREIFSLDEMVEAFDLDRVATSGPVFDLEKLDWLNGQYLRALSPEAFADRVAEWGLRRDRLARLVPLVQSRTERLIDLAPQVDYLLGERPPLTAGHFAHRTLEDGGLPARAAPRAARAGRDARGRRRSPARALPHPGREHGPQAPRLPVSPVRGGVRTPRRPAAVRLRGVPRTRPRAGTHPLGPGGARRRLEEGRQAFRPGLRGAARRPRGPGSGLTLPSTGTYYPAASWGHSSAGRARQWHC